MSFDYAGMQNTASELLTDFNQGVLKLIKVTDGTGPAYNPGTPAEIPFDIQGTVKGVSAKYVDNELILASDFQITASVHPTETPTLKDKVSIDGTLYDIVKIITVPPAGIPIINTLIVR